MDKNLSEVPSKIYLKLPEELLKENQKISIRFNKEEENNYIIC